MSRARRTADFGWTGPVSFRSRPELAGYIARKGAEDGVLYFDGNRHYLGQTGATATPGLPGLVPALEVTPDHMGAAGDGVTDDTAALTAWLNYGGDLFLPDGKTYLFTNVIVVNTPNGRLRGGGKLVAGPASGFTDTTSATHRGAILFNVQDGWDIEGIEVDTTAWTALPPGATSARALHFNRCSAARVNKNRFRVATGAISFVGGSDREITGNRIEVVQMGALATIPADGVIDVWVSFDVDAKRDVITENVIRGGGFARWGIMQTGLTFGAQVMSVEQSIVANNVVEDCFYDGIWVFGRAAGLVNANVSNNVVRNCRKGVAMSDATGSLIQGNIIQGCPSQGIHCFMETANGGNIGVVDTLVTSNVIIDCASDGDATNPALWVQHGQCLVSENLIKGTTHGIGVAVGTLAVGTRVFQNEVEKGRGSRYSLPAETRTDANVYTPTLTGTNNVTTATVTHARYFVIGEDVLVMARVNFITPAAGFTQALISLPIPSDILAGTLYGTGTTDNNLAVVVVPDATNDVGAVRFTAGAAGTFACNLTFSYTIN